MEAHINSSNSSFQHSRSAESVMKLASSGIYSLKDADKTGRLVSSRPFLMALLRRCKRKLEVDGHFDQLVPGGDNVWRRKILHLAKRIRRRQTANGLSSLRVQLAMLSDVDGDRPIHVAVANENLKLVNQLCYLMTEASISLDLTNHLRQTPLHLAVMLGNIDMVNLLLKFGASPLLCDRNGNSVLHLAMKSLPKKDIISTLLSHPEVNSVQNAMDHEGYTALHYAVFKNNLDAVTLFHQNRVDINKVDGKSGRTALIHAILEQKSEMVRLLLSCEACPQTADYSGRSAYEMALQMSNPQIIEILDNYRSSQQLSRAEGQRTSSSRIHLKTAID